MKIAITAAPSKIQYFVNQAYVNYVKQSGFEPILVTEHNDPAMIAALCDGLLLPGGIDLDPIYYGENNLWCEGSQPSRDEFERKMMRAFADENKKIFGICRGFQLIAREFLRVNGNHAEAQILNFSQNVSGHTATGTLEVARDIPHHFVHANMSILYGNADNAYKPLAVNSMHHQAFYMGGPDLVQNVAGLRVLAFTQLGLAAKSKKLPATKKGGLEKKVDMTGFIIEAIDIPAWNCRGVQWHPEELMDTALLNSFFNEGNLEQAIGA